MTGILKRIKALHLPKYKFVVMGSANMEIKGIRAAHDLDIMVDNRVFDYVQGEWKYCTATGRFGEDKEWLEKPEVEMHRLILRFGHKFDLNHFFREPWRIEEIDGILFSSLKHISLMKRLYNREKDWKDLELIREYQNAAELENSTATGAYRHQDRPS